MTHPSNPGPHLDADQLNAFAEGVLPEHEHQHALTHLAECTDCRQIVFLAQEPLPLPATEPVAEPFWRRWFGPLVLAGTVAAAAAIAIVLLNPRRPSPLPVQNEAANHTPVSQPSNPQSNAASLSPPPKSAEEVPPELSSKKIPATAPPKTEPTANASPTPPSRVKDSALIADKTAPQTTPQPRTSIHGSITGAPVITAGAGLETPAPPPPAPDAQRYQQPPSISRNAAPVLTESENSADARGTATASVAKKPPTPVFAAAPGSQNLHMEPNQPTTDAFSAINGSVTDPSGATIPGATITLRQLPGSATTQTATNAAGKFTIPTLPAGKYEMQIASPGFQSLTRQIDLKPHDLAQLDSKLSLGAASETVTVEAASAQVTTQSAESYGLIPDRDVALPGKRKAVITVASGATVLALDATGKLYLRTNGRHWKQVHPSWPGKAAQLSLTPTTNQPDITRAAPPPPTAPPPPVFRLTTDSGSVWVSSDGEHWGPL